tara:strand:+ start:750 stop:2264 length:1515 start_codon:yes stop_codon:yes gene_type:complete
MERSKENKFYNFNLPSSYQTGLRKIADQQRAAKMLQQQAQAPTERFSYKGIEAHTPATAGLAKMLQGLTGTYLQGKARDEEEALGKKYQTESSDLLRQAFDAGSGTPAVAGKFVPGADEVFDEDLGLDQLSPATPSQIVGGAAAVPGDPQRMAQLLMQNPSPDIQKRGAEQMQKAMDSQAFMNAGMGTGAPVAGKMPAGTFGGLAGGQAMAVWMRLDPTGGLYTEQLATDKRNQENDDIDEAKLQQQIAEWNGMSAAQKEQLKSQGITNAIALARARAEGLNVPLPSSTGVTVAQSSTTPTPGAAPPGSPPRQEGASTTPPADLGLSLNQRREALAVRVLQEEKNKKSIAAYFVGTNAVIDALKNTAGGPLLGNFPAFTANAQIAESTIAALAPILKDLFREAGEGVFTKDDQEILMAMIPGRYAQPGVAIKALENIDRMLAAKLGIAVPPRPWGKAAPTQPTRAMRARNPTTGEVIISTDGGKTWNKAERGAPFIPDPPAGSK